MSKTFIIDGVETECLAPQEYYEEHPDDFFPLSDLEELDVEKKEKEEKDDD